MLKLCVTLCCRPLNPPGYEVKQAGLPSELGIEPGFSGGTASALNPEPLLQSIRSPFNAYICIPELEKQNQHLKRTLPSAIA